MVSGSMSHSWETIKKQWISSFKKHIVSAWELTWQFIVSPVLMTLVVSGVAVIVLGVLAPVTMAGYMQSILLVIREGVEPKIQDLFSEMTLRPDILTGS